MMKGETKSALGLSILAGISFCGRDSFGSRSFITFSINSLSIFSNEKSFGFFGVFSILTMLGSMLCFFIARYRISFSLIL